MESSYNPENYPVQKTKDYKEIKLSNDLQNDQIKGVKYGQIMEQSSQLSGFPQNYQIMNKSSYSSYALQKTFERVQQHSERESHTSQKIANLEEQNDDPQKKMQLFKSEILSQSYIQHIQPKVTSFTFFLITEQPIKLIDIGCNTPPLFIKKENKKQKYGVLPKPENIVHYELPNFEAKINGKYYYLMDHHMILPITLEYYVEIFFQTKQSNKFPKKAYCDTQNIELIFEKNLLISDTEKFVAFRLLLEEKKFTQTEQFIQQLEQKSNIQAEQLVYQFTEAFKNNTFDSTKINDIEQYQSKLKLFELQTLASLKLFLKVANKVCINCDQLIKHMKINTQVRKKLFQTLKQQSKERKSLVNVYFHIASQQIKIPEQEDQKCQQINSQIYEIISQYNEFICPKIQNNCLENQIFLKFLKNLDFGKFLKLLESTCILKTDFCKSIFNIYVENKKIVTKQLLQFLKLSSKYQILSERLIKILKQQLHSFQSSLDKYQLRVGIKQFQQDTEEHKFLHQIIQDKKTLFNVPKDNEIAICKRQYDIKNLLTNEPDSVLNQVLLKSWQQFKQSCVLFKFNKENPQQDFRKLLLIKLEKVKKFIEQANNAEVSAKDQYEMFKKLGQTTNKISIENHKIFNQIQITLKQKECEARKKYELEQQNQYIQNISEHHLIKQNQQAEFVHE